MKRADSRAGRRELACDPRDVVSRHVRESLGPLGRVRHEVGPDLAAQSHRSVEDLLTHILDPDAAINPNYAAFVAETTDGQKQAGILVSSSGANIVLRQAMGLQVEIPRAKVKSLQSTGHSLMPAGQEALFTPQEMRDLIAFLQKRE